MPEYSMNRADAFDRAASAVAQLTAGEGGFVVSTLIQRVEAVTFLADYLLRESGPAVGDYVEITQGDYHGFYGTLREIDGPGPETPFRVVSEDIDVWVAGVRKVA